MVVVSWMYVYSQYSSYPKPTKEAKRKFDIAAREKECNLMKMLQLNEWRTLTSEDGIIHIKLIARK